VTDLSPEDDKLLTLARGARTRTGANEGAAIRDDIGRMYAAANVSLSSLTLTALQAVVAAAISSGSTSFEAAVVVTQDSDVAAADRQLLGDIGEPTLHVITV
jgi:cytidine deaminase